MSSVKCLWFVVVFNLSNMNAQNLDSPGRTYIQDFNETFRNEDFKIGNYTIVRDKESAYFNIEVVLQNEGVYLIKQTFEYEAGYGYKYNSLLNIIKAGKKGSPRYFNNEEPNLFISNTCNVGDTVVIPVFWNSHIRDNKFSTGDEQERKAWGKAGAPPPNANDKKQLNWSIDNKIDELKVLDVNSYRAVHRGLNKESVWHEIVFEAIKSGTFLLSVRESKMPVTIHPRNNSIKKFVTQVIGVQWDDHATSYSLPPDYKKQTSGAILRVGDVFYFTFSHYDQEISNPRILDLNIQVNRLENSKK